MATDELSESTAAGLYAATPEGDARQFLDYLIDRPGVQLWSETMQTDLGFAEHKQIALAAWTIGKEASKLGLKRPWNEAQRGYSMAEREAALLSAARAESR